MQIFGCEWEKTNFWWGKEEKVGTRGKVLERTGSGRDRRQKGAKGGAKGSKRGAKGQREGGRKEGIKVLFKN